MSEEDKSDNKNSLINNNETNLNKNEIKNFKNDYFANTFSGDTHLRIIGGLFILLWTVHSKIFLIFFLILIFIAISIKFGKFFFFFKLT